MLRLGEQRLRRRGLDDTAGVHDGDAIGVTGHDTQVVGDEDDAHLVLVAQLVDEVEDLHLRRDIQGRRRLVRDENTRLAHEGHGDHDALAHAARELVRVVVDDNLGARHADALEDLDGAREGFPLREILVHAQRLAHLKADLHSRVQGGQRILEDHADLGATHLALHVQRHLRQVLAVEDDRAGGDLAALGEQTHEGQSRHGLARSGLAHDAQGLARVHVQVDTREGANNAVADLNIGVQIFDLKEWSIHSSVLTSCAVELRRRHAGRRQ